MARRYGKAESVDGGAVPYEIDDTLSVGAFSVAYAARTPDGKKVFLKQYKSPSPLVEWYRSYIDYQEELKRRVQSNPTLVSRTYEFVDFFEADRAFIQVFGFIEGGKDLRQYLDEGRMSLRQRWEFATSFLLTLQRFHQGGIVHSDLKPENIYLMPASGPGGGWNVKLIDFDFTILSGLTPPWDGKMGYVGTPRYLSPEHLRREVPNEGSDVFTAALICHELLCEGGHPYPDDEEEYRRAALDGTTAKPRFLAAETPELAKFGNLLSQALSPDARARPSAGDLSSALKAARDPWVHSTRPVVVKADSAPSCDSVPSPDPIPPPKPAAGTFQLVGAKGETPPLSLGLTFGRGNLAVAIGDDAQFAGSAQFRIHRRNPGEDGWWISLVDSGVKNPPLVDGKPVTVEPTRLENGSVITAVSSRRDPSVRKGEMKVLLG